MFLNVLTKTSLSTDIVYDVSAGAKKLGESVFRIMYVESMTNLKKTSVFLASITVILVFCSCESALPLVRVATKIQITAKNLGIKITFY